MKEICRNKYLYKELKTCLLFGGQMANYNLTVAASLIVAPCNCSALGYSSGPLCMLYFEHLNLIIYCGIDTIHGQSSFVLCLGCLYFLEL